ncbi:helix-turn-helix domain-containing protein [Oenococcus oeni]|nr:helix-turn-helix domain-containing protein [Oenococcus oeni]
MIPCSLNSFDRQIRYGKEFTEIVSEKHLGGKILFPRKEIEEYLRSI